MNRSLTPLLVLAITLEACASQPLPEPTTSTTSITSSAPTTPTTPSASSAPSKPVSLFGNTTTSVDTAHPVNLSMDILLVTEDASTQVLDQEKQDAQTFVAHINVLYEKTGVRFALRHIARFAVSRDMWNSHVPMRTILPPPADSSAYTLYLVPAMTTKDGAQLNGAALGSRTAAVGLNARLSSAGAQGVIEPTVRVAGHILGSMLGLAESKDPKNLMASGTTGTELQPSQVAALQVPTDLSAQSK